MDSVTIKCDRCKAELDHVCDEKLIDALIRAYRMHLDFVPKGFNRKKSEGYEKGDEDTPFFSEAFLYNLLGKEDARTVLAVLSNIARAAGFDPFELQRRAFEEDKKEGVRK